VVFRLYDTFGIPADVITSMAAEDGFEVDTKGYERALEEQRNRARAASGFKEGAGEIEKKHSAKKTPFLGYDSLEADVTVEEAREAAKAGADAKRGDGAAERAIELVLDRTPFYAESGGQVGDTGTIQGEGWRVEVRDTTTGPDGRTVHHGVVKEGKPAAGMKARASVDGARRAHIIRNHTATHLLQAALREVLGTHVRQNGSLVAPDRLRFDFAHYAQLTEAERAAIEERVNADILADRPVTTRVTSYKDAREAGALAFFGEKYGDTVRVVKVEGRSQELCGGTHVSATGQIGLFTLVHESGVAAGVRRIEAFTGEGAWRDLKRRSEALEAAAAALRTPWESIPERVTKLIEEHRESARELEKLRAASREDEAGALASNAKTVGDVRVVAAQLAGEVEKSALRPAVDALREELGRGVVVLAGVHDGRVLLAAGVTPDLVKEGKLNAGKIVGEVARKVGGGGGGRPDFAEGGGKNPEGLAEALRAVEGIVQRALGS